LEKEKYSRANNRKIVTETISSLKAILKNHPYMIGCALYHLLSDGFFVVMYPLLPLIAQDFKLPLSRVGILRTCLSFSASFLQLPSAILSERLWEMTFLSIGMSWVALGFMIMGFSITFFQLLIFSFISGIGASIQHPVATSFISRVYDNRKRGSAIGLLNFSGDLGKIIFPIIISTLLLSYNWKSCLIFIGSAGFLFSISSGFIFRKKSNSTYEKKDKNIKSRGSWGITSPWRFTLLSIIGIIDGTTRTVLLTFIPFLFLKKGIQKTRIGFMLTLLFTGGAAGKLGCGYLADRIGNMKMIILTETLTALSILLFLPMPKGYLIPLLIFCGFVLNGTSSVLYTTVADLVVPEKRALGYGLFYTIYLGAESFGPAIFGFIGDTLGLRWIFFILAITTFMILPLIIPLRDKHSASNI